ncbi:putative aminoacrylate hydrolase RutD [Streptomyces sp. RB5]|uniref:Putative aminoacrylate hydrolase RutD n=1 Tax=Streptomyces smaragdinus TaxID=2585196 RepID=A0A7K0CPB7_9ACTN|nr:alpha/beta hydrolase [Streptomyces smaragdinus]MQY15251.1 putative aminoacrylate hydrolase RutD [Streptomyces smaragdinus]
MSPRTHVTTGPFAPPAPRLELDVTSADGARLYAEVHGPEDAPAVVLAHGWTCSTAFWAAVVKDLAVDHKVVVYDQRGHGRSPASATGYSTSLLADDLGAVLQAALGPGERAVLAGHSMGAMTLMAAADRPYLRERAAALLLCSTGAAKLKLESRVFAVGPKALRGWAHRTFLHSRLPLGPVTPVGKKLLRYATMGPGARPAEIEACAYIVHACPPKARGRWGRVLSALDLEAQVRRIPVPTAVIQGLADRLTPAVHGRRLAAGLPDCLGVTELPGMGHMTPVEAPDAVSGAIRGLVKGHLMTEGERA